MRPKIVITHRIHAEVQQKLQAAGDLITNETVAPWSPATLQQYLHDATALMGFMTDRVDAELLQQTPHLKIIACALKGYDSYDVDACTRANIWVSIVPDLLTEPTAELAIGLAIGLARHIRTGDEYMRQVPYEGWRTHFYGQGLDQSTVGIIGMGQVGRAIAQRLQGFGCARLLGFDPHPFIHPHVQHHDLTGILQQSDYLFLAAPLTETNRHMLDAETLKACKPGQLMINVGRGSVVDELAVAELLRHGQLGGYAADVYACEDWALKNRPAGVPQALLESDKTLLTPHIGSAVQRVRLAIEHRAADNILAVLSGQVPPDAINRVQANAAPSAVSGVLMS
jgi:phosphonate dehydrogenase